MLWLPLPIHFIALISLTHARFLVHPGFNRRSNECKINQPGGVLVQVMQPGTWGTPLYPDGPTTEQRYSSEDGCITKATILGGHPSNNHVTSIAPDQGGHCLVYHSQDCQVDTGMPLNNPDHLHLKFPNKIICPEVDSRMLPYDWIALKCYNHEAWQ